MAANTGPAHVEPGEVAAGPVDEDGFLLEEPATRVLGRTESRLRRDDMWVQSVAPKLGPEVAARVEEATSEATTKPVKELETEGAREQRQSAVADVAKDVPVIEFATKQINLALAKKFGPKLDVTYTLPSEDKGIQPHADDAARATSPDTAAAAAKEGMLARRRRLKQRISERKKRNHALLVSGTENEETAKLRDQQAAVVTGRESLHSRVKDRLQGRAGWAGFLQRKAREYRHQKRAAVLAKGDAVVRESHDEKQFPFRSLTGPKNHHQNEHANIHKEKELWQSAKNTLSETQLPTDFKRTFGRDQAMPDFSHYLANDRMTAAGKRVAFLQKLSDFRRGASEAADRAAAVRAEMLEAKAQLVELRAKQVATAESASFAARQLMVKTLDKKEKEVADKRQAARLAAKGVHKMMKLLEEFDATGSEAFLKYKPPEEVEAEREARRLLKEQKEGVGMQELVAGEHEETKQKKASADTAADDFGDTSTQSDTDSDAYDSALDAPSGEGEDSVSSSATDDSWQTRKHRDLRRRRVARSRRRAERRAKRKEELFESSKGGAFWDAVKQGRTMVHQDLEAKKDRIHKMKYVRSPACVCVWGCVCMAEAHVVAL